MPLDPETIRNITAYYRKNLGHYGQFIEKFDMIVDKKLQRRLAQEYYMARYIAGIQSAMNFNENSFELLAHLKFQIVQYAGIYEAVISNVLIKKFGNDEMVLKLQKSEFYSRVDALSNGTEIRHNGDTVYICKKSEKKLGWDTNKISFDNKLKVAKQIGFVKEEIGKTILEIYGLRHSVHPEKAVKAEIIFHKEQVNIASKTMDVFLSDIRKFLTKK